MSCKKITLINNIIINKYYLFQTPAFSLYERILIIFLTKISFVSFSSILVFAI